MAKNTENRLKPARVHNTFIEKMQLSIAMLLKLFSNLKSKTVFNNTKLIILSIVYKITIIIKYEDFFTIISK